MDYRARKFNKMRLQMLYRPSANSRPHLNDTPLFRIESAAGFTAEVDRQGERTYLDKGQVESIPSTKLSLGAPKNGREIAARNHLDRITPDQIMTWLGVMYEIWYNDQQKELGRVGGW